MPKRNSTRSPVAAGMPAIESMLDPIGQRLLHLYLVERRLEAELTAAAKAGVVDKSLGDPTDRACAIIDAVSNHLTPVTGPTLAQLVKNSK